MANWLKPFGAPPAKKIESLPPNAGFDAKLAAFKEAHGFRERYTMLCYCTRHGRPFETVFQRASATEQFTVSEVKMLGEQAGASGKASAPDEKRLKASEINIAGWQCPYCRTDSWVQCQCGTNTCNHQLKMSGGSLHRCEPGCGKVAGVVPMVEMVASSTSDRPQASAGAARKPAIAGAKRGSLPSPTQLKLPGIR